MLFRAKVAYPEQIPYGFIIALSILTCVFLNDRFENRRCVFILIFLLPNLAGAFGLRFVPTQHSVGRLICYYLTGPYNAAFVLVLSMQIANTAGKWQTVLLLHTYKDDRVLGVLTSVRPHQKGSDECSPVPGLLHWQYCRSFLLQI